MEKPAPVRMVAILLALALLAPLWPSAAKAGEGAPKQHRADAYLLAVSLTGVVTLTGLPSQAGLRRKSAAKVKEHSGNLGITVRPVPSKKSQLKTFIPEFQRVSDELKRKYGLKTAKAFEFGLGVCATLVTSGQQRNSMLVKTQLMGLAAGLDPGTLKTFGAMAKKYKDSKVFAEKAKNFMAVDVKEQLQLLDAMGE